VTDLDHAAALDALDAGYQKVTDAVTAPPRGLDAPEAADDRGGSGHPECPVRPPTGLVCGVINRGDLRSCGCLGTPP